MSRTSRSSAREPAERPFAYVPRGVTVTTVAEAETAARVHVAGRDHVHTFLDLGLVQRVTSRASDCDQCRVSALLHTSPWDAS